MCRDSAHCGDCEDCQRTDEWIVPADLRRGLDPVRVPPLSRDGGEPR